MTQASKTVELYADVGTCARTGRPVRLHYNTFGSRTAPRTPVTGTTNSINISKVSEGDSSEVQLPCILLIMDFGDATLRWEDAFCDALAAAGPFFVVRFDTRDAGLSTQFTQTSADNKSISASTSNSTQEGNSNTPSSLTSKQRNGTTSTSELLGDVLGDETTEDKSSTPKEENENTTQASSSTLSCGLFSSLRYLKYMSTFLQHGQLSSEATYTVEDMASDTFGLLDHLHVSRVHVVGISLGGMIAQCMAVRQPTRLASLTLIATHSSEPGLVRWPAVRHLLGLAQHIPSIATATPQAEKVRLYATGFTRLLRRVSGDDARYAFDQPGMQARLMRHFEQNPSMRNIGRQLAALLHAKGRDAELRRSITSVAPTPTTQESQTDAGNKTGNGQRPVYIPTLIVHGTEDILYPTDNATHLSHVIEGSTLVVIEGMGHVVVPSLYGRFVELIANNVRRGEAHTNSNKNSSSDLSKPLAKVSVAVRAKQSHL